MKNTIKDYQAQIARLSKVLEGQRRNRYKKILATIKNKDFKITMMFLHNSVLTHKQYRVILYSAVEAGNSKLANYLASEFLKRDLRYSENARINKIRNSLISN